MRGVVLVSMLFVTLASGAIDAQRSNPPGSDDRCAGGTTDTSLARPAIEVAKAGSTTVKGSAILMKGTVAVCVNRSPIKIADPSNPKSFGDDLPVTEGRFNLILSDPLKANEDLLVVVTSDDGEQRLTGRTTVSAAAVKRVRPEVQGNLVPGQTSIYVIASRTEADSQYEVQLFTYVNDSPVQLKGPSGSFKAYMLADSEGQATITLAQPLAAGTEVAILQKIVNKTDQAQVEQDRSKSVAVTDPLDLGRMRYYFTSGIVLSNNHGFQQSSGTQAGIFLGLDVDRSWLAPVENGWRQVGFNTYFDVRLTSVATQQSVSAPSADIAQSVLQSQKAGSLQTGAYLPIACKPWALGEYSYSLVVAPLAKAGFTTLTDNSPATVVSTSGNSIATTPVTERFFTSYSYGARFGVFQHFRGAAKSPDTVSYVDVTVGKFGDFEAFRNTATTGQPPELIRVRPWRYSFEGLLKVPHSPFIVGFNANIGTGAWPPDKNGGVIYPYTQPRDDLRFLFGARFDLAKLLKAVPQL